MDCDRMGELLDRLLDGELSEEERRAMEAHGRECPACADAIRATMQMKALFAGMDTEADVPLEAQARWRGAVKAEVAAQRKRRIIRWVASAAAAVVAVAGISLTMNGRNAPQSGAGSVAMKSAIEEDAVMEEAAETAEPGMAALPNVAATSAPVLSESAIEAEDYVDAGSAVVEADGSTEANAISIDGEADGLVVFEENDEPLVCAAVAQRAPACELVIRVEDVEATCKSVADLAEEYEGTADVQALADGGANIYVEIAAGNADDFLNAVLPLDISDGEIELPELSDEGSLLLLLTINR